MLRGLKLQNFCQHRSLEIEFSPGVTMILGGNGQGKSNTARAIKFAMTGESGNDGPRQEDWNWQAAAEQEPGFVELRFDKNGTDGLLKRYVNQTRASLRFGAESTNAARQVNARVLDVLGTTKRTLDDIVFVPQGEIERILFERPSDRARKFQGLLGTENAETIRRLLQQELGGLSIDPVDDRIALLEVRLSDEIDPQLQTLNDKHAVALGFVQQFDYDKLQDAVSAFELARNTRQNQGIIAGKVTGAQAQVDTLRASVSAMTTNVDIATGVAEQLAGGAMEARTALANMETAQRLSNTRLSLQQRLQEARAYQQQPAPQPPAVTVELVKNGHKELATSRATLDQQGVIIATFQHSDQPSCPTCGTEITDKAAMIAKAQNVIDTLRPKAQKLAVDLDAAATALTAYAHAESQHSSLKTMAEKQIPDLELELAALPDSTIDTSDVAALQQLVREHESTVEDARTGGEQLQRQREQLVQNEAVLAAALTEQQGLQQALADTCSEGDYITFKSNLVDISNARLDLANLEGQLEQLKSHRAATLQQLEGARAQAGQMEVVKTYRDLCERARAVLHRDVLPQMVTRTYLRQLNPRISQYLKEFRVPFDCWIKDDLEVMCIFPGVGEKSAGRLSGGEQVMLGIAFRFAVYGLSGSELGFMVLDEPTNMVDAEHVAYVAELLQRVRAYVRDAGLQLIVITHEPQLVGAADQVIQL